MKDSFMAEALNQVIQAELLVELDEPQLMAA